MALFIDGKPYKKKEALSFLGIDPSFIPAVRQKIIQVVTKRINENMVRPPKSIGGKPAYLVYVPHLEKEVEIRYAITPPRPHETIVNKLVYPHPKTLTIHPAEDGTFLIPDELEFIFWFLRPMCEQSPFRNKDHAHYYGFKDDNATATRDMELEEKRILANSIIVGPMAWADNKLKHLAKGMGIQGVDDMMPMVIKNELRKLAYKDPTDFYNKANSKEVIFTGKIQEAIDQKVLVLKSLNGMQRWYLGSEEVLPIAFGQNAIIELKNHMAEKWYLYADKINDSLNGVTLSIKLNAPQNDAAFEDTPPVPKERIRAELSPEEIDVLKEIREKDYLLDKCKKWANLDVNDPKLHVATRNAMLQNTEMLDIYRKARDAGELSEYELAPYIKKEV